MGWDRRNCEGVIGRMRVLVLLAISAVTLAACDSPYGSTPQYVSQKSYVTTGSHLKSSGDQDSSKVEVLNGAALDRAQTQTGTGRAPGSP